MISLLNKLIFVSLCCIVICGISFAAPNIEGIQVYQKNLRLSAEHKQNLADAITRYRNADNIWDVLREEFALPHYEDNPAVQEKIEWFMNNQDFLLRSSTRAAPYLYYIMQQVKKRHLPAELVLLPIIESGYNPYSLSNVGAAGIWQLMPGTASDLGVKQDFWYDGRRDVITSTRAALNYLAYLQSFFEGKWLLAIAAYNTGEGNVVAAIRRNIRDGKDTDFWSLPVAQQTKDYVPSLLALAVIISQPDKYPIYFPPVRNAPYLAQVDIGSQINLKFAAQIAGLSYKRLMQLNPGFNRPLTSIKGPYKLVLPIENVEQFAENLTHTPLNTQIHWIHYKVKSGDTLASISKKFNTTPIEIRKMNHLAKNILHHGSNLLIPGITTQPAEEASFEMAEEVPKPKIKTSPTTSETLLLSSKSKYIEAATTAFTQTPSTEKYILKPGDTIYMVRAKDTLESVANRFHTSSQMLQAANNLRSKKLTSGKEIIIPTHLNSDHSDTSTVNQLQPGDTIYMVRRGDTIEKIAIKYRTTPSEIRLANLMERKSLEEGERIVIPTHMSG